MKKIKSRKNITASTLVLLCIIGLLGVLIPSKIAKAQAVIIKEIFPIITLENGEYIAQTEEDAHYTIIDVADSKLEPYFDGENVNLFDETLLVSNSTKQAENSFNKYVVLSLKANEGYEFDNELTTNLSKEYTFINTNINKQVAVIIAKYDATPKDEETENPQKEESSVENENNALSLVETLKPRTNKDTENVKYINNHVNNTLMAQKGSDKVSQTPTNNEKAGNIPKTDDNFLPLLAVIGVMILTSGIGTVILCRRYC